MENSFSKTSSSIKTTYSTKPKNYIKEQEKEKRMSFKPQKPKILTCIPQMEKSLNKMEDIETDIHYIYFKNKNKNGNRASFQTSDLERTMKKLQKKIDHSNVQLDIHEVCHKNTMKEKDDLAEKRLKNINQSNYLNDVNEFTEKDISDMRKQIKDLQNQTQKFEFKSLKLKEEIKYMKKDIKLYNEKINNAKSQRDKLQNEVNKVKQEIYNITKGAKLNPDFIKKITKMIKSEN
jgi:chromosome segregation ATPase